MVNINIVGLPSLPDSLTIVRVPTTMVPTPIWMPKGKRTYRAIPSPLLCTTLPVPVLVLVPPRTTLLSKETQRIQRTQQIQRTQRTQQIQRTKKPKHPVQIWSGWA